MWVGRVSSRDSRFLSCRSPQQWSLGGGDVEQLARDHAVTSGWPASNNAVALVLLSTSQEVSEGLCTAQFPLLLYLQD
jgi:hypothetical protein